jgi:hypothetical protein
VTAADPMHMACETSGLQELRSGELLIEPTVAPEGLQLVWRGRSTAPEPRAILIPYFQRAIEIAQRLGAPVEMNFEGLEYFNSSTIAALIDAIRIGTECRVPVVMIYKQAVRWQRMSFDALRMLTQEHDFRLRAV